MLKIKDEEVVDIKEYDDKNGYIYANEITKKKIGQYDKNDNLIKIYESISEASRQTGINIMSISCCANKKRKSGGGYLWHFV